MKVLFDQGTPAPLRRYLAGHTVDTAYERGWADLSNGDLLNAAEMSGYHLLITTDQNLKYQQNLAGRHLAILVLLTTSWPRMQQKVDEISNLVNSMNIGDYEEFGA